VKQILRKDREDSQFTSVQVTKPKQIPFWAQRRTDQHEDSDSDEGKSSSEASEGGENLRWLNSEKNAKENARNLPGSNGHDADAIPRHKGSPEERRSRSFTSLSQMYNEFNIEKKEQEKKVQNVA
jgi:hypothetical protein